MEWIRFSPTHLIQDTGRIGDLGDGWQDDLQNFSNFLRMRTRSFWNLGLHCINWYFLSEEQSNRLFYNQIENKTIKRKRNWRTQTHNLCPRAMLIFCSMLSMLAVHPSIHTWKASQPSADPIPQPAQPAATIHWTTQRTFVQELDWEGRREDGWKDGRTDEWMIVRERERERRRDQSSPYIYWDYWVSHQRINCHKKNASLQLQCIVLYYVQIFLIGVAVKI